MSIARVQISFPAFFVNPSSHAVTAATTASVQVNKRNSDGTSGAAATVYAGPTGGTTASNPITPDGAGRIPGWLEPGKYNFVISGPGVTTFTQAWDANLDSPLKYNVKDFGALGDGSTEDSGAIQSCINYVQAQGGGIVYSPPGTYLINGGLTVASGPPVRLLGSGMPMNHGGLGVGYQGTWFKRTAGGSGVTMIECHATDAAKGFLSIEHLGLHGGTQAGLGIDLAHCDLIDIDRVTFTSILDTALKLGTIYNSGLGKLWFVSCGNGLAKPAVLITSASDAVSGEGSATVHFIRVEIEASRGTDLELDGSTNNPANDIQFGELKIEGGSVGFTEPCPMIRLRNCQNISFSNLNINAHTARSVTPIQEDRLFNTTRATKWSNLNCGNSGDQSFPYFMQLSHGAWTVASACFDGTANGPSTAHIRIESTVSTGLFRQGACIATSGKPLVSDARGLPSVASGASITLPRLDPVVLVTGTTNISTIAAAYPGFVVTLIFSGALTVTSGSNLKIDGDFTTTANDTLTVVSDGTNWIEQSRSTNP